MIDSASIDTVLELLLPSIIEHQKCQRQAFVLGLSGLQGSGKSTWAAALVDRLGGHGLKARAISLDDLYLDHDELKARRESQPNNALLRTRGHPGTHDESLAVSFFDQLLTPWPDAQSDYNIVQWPAYDKSLHSGQGGRVPVDQWERVQGPLDVLIFEGWCLGFQPLSDAAVKEKWENATTTGRTGLTDTLSEHRLEDLLLLNSNLRRYCDSFMGPWRFNGFLHLSTDKLVNVYDWRLDQERSLRKTRPGMTDDEVVQFVKGYMPGYELFLEGLDSHSMFRGQSTRAKHIRVSMDDGRDVTKITEMQ